MLLPAAAARRFINGYQAVALSVHAVLGLPLPEDPRQVVRAARERFSEDPLLLWRAVAQLKRRGLTPDPEVLDALGQLRLDRWVHLKDLKRGAILLDLEGREAFSVVGLTQPLASITGRTGLVIKTALCPFPGRILCDGLIVTVAELGPAMGRSYQERYSLLKAAGRLHRDPALAPLWQAP